MKGLMVLLFVFAYNYIQAQSMQNCYERIQNSWFTYISIPENKYAGVDSIRFVMSPYEPENPIIIFSAGSGNSPLFFIMDEDSVHAYLNTPFNVYEYAKDFNFVYISKPGVPLCTEFTENPLLIDTTFPDIMTFYKMDFLDYYVNQLGQVVDYLRNLSESPIYLVGGSQGGSVVIKYASTKKENVAKIVPFSSGILDRSYEEILYWRQLADLKQITHEEAQRNIDDVYESYFQKRDYYKYFEQNPNAEIAYNATPDQHYRILTDYSYNFGEVSLDYLLKIDIPILCVYGTDDIKARDNDMLPLFFARAGKNNITMLPQLYCDHSFFERKPNEETGEIEEKYLGNEVFRQIFEWLSKSSDK